MEDQRSPMIVNLKLDWKIHSANSDLARERKKGKMKLQQDRKDNKNNASSSQIRPLQISQGFTLTALTHTHPQK